MGLPEDRKSNDDRSTATVSFTSKKHLTRQSTRDTSGNIPIASEGAQRTPKYMAPTISSLMKMNEKRKQCTSSEPPVRILRKRRSVSRGLQEYTSVTPLRGRKSFVRKLCQENGLVGNAEVESVTSSNQQHLQQTPTQPIRTHSHGLYHNYLKPLLWDPVVARNDEKSRMEGFINERRTTTTAVDSMVDSELQLSQRNSHMEKTNFFHPNSGHLQPEVGVNYAFSTSSLSTAQVQTSACIWQQTISRTPCRISRIDRFAPNCMKDISAQKCIVESSQWIMPLEQFSFKTDKYKIWQWITSDSSQKLSRFDRFSKPEISVTKSITQPLEVLFGLEQSINQYTLIVRRKARMMMIWKRTIFNSFPQFSRFDRFAIATIFQPNISHKCDFIETKTSLSSNTPTSTALSIHLENEEINSQEVSAQSIHSSPQKLSQVSSAKCSSDGSNLIASKTGSHLVFPSYVLKNSRRGTWRKSSRNNRFRDSTSLDAFTSQSQLSVTPSSERNLCIQTEAIQSEKVSRCQRNYPDFHLNTDNTSVAMDGSSRFKRFQNNSLPNSTSSTFTQNLSHQIFCKNLTKQSFQSSAFLQRAECCESEKAISIDRPLGANSPRYLLFNALQDSSLQSSDSSNSCM